MSHLHLWIKSNLPGKFCSFFFFCKPSPKKDWKINLHADKSIQKFLRRKNFLGENWLKGVYPDYKIRLYHKKYSYYDAAVKPFFCSLSQEKKNLLCHPTFKNYSD